jgi:hypothetical protein
MSGSATFTITASSVTRKKPSKAVRSVTADPLAVRTTAGREAVLEMVTTASQL